MQTLWLKTKPHSFQEKAHPKLSKVACTIHTHNHSLTTDESTVCIVFCCFHCLHQKLKTCMTIDKLLQNNLWFLSDFLAFNHCQRKQKVLQGLHTCDQTQNSWVNQWKIHNLSSAQCCKKIITQVVVKREKGIHSKPKNEKGAFHLILFWINQCLRPFHNEPVPLALSTCTSLKCLFVHTSCVGNLCHCVVAASNRHNWTFFKQPPVKMGDQQVLCLSCSQHGLWRGFQGVQSSNLSILDSGWQCFIVIIISEIISHCCQHWWNWLIIVIGHCQVTGGVNEKPTDCTPHFKGNVTLFLELMIIW